MLRSLDKALIIIYGIWIFAVVSSIVIIPLISASPALTDDLVSYWQLEETGAGTANDSLGINNLTVTGATRNVPGKILLAYSFDGSDDLAIHSPFNYTDVSEQPVTVNAWFNSTDLVSYEVVTSKSIIEGGATIFEILRNGDKVRVRSNRASGTVEVYCNTYPISANVWVMATIISNGTGIYAYVNGTYCNSAANSADISGTPSFFSVGAGNYGVKWGHFNGVIDEIGIWSRSLTDTEISALWNNGDGFSYPFAVDTCTCPGAGNDWEIDMSDYCNITDACDLTTGTLSFTGAGWCNCNASVDTTNLGDPGASGVLYIQDSCLITID